MATWAQNCQILSMADTCLQMYHISSIRHHGYYLFRWSFCAATIQRRLLFKGGVYFFGKPGDTNDGLDKVRTSETVIVARPVSSTCRLSLLLSAMGTTRTTQTVLALAWWPSSEIIRTRVHVLRLLAAAKIWGRCIFRLRASDCELLFEGGVYSKKYGRCTNTYAVWHMNSALNSRERYPMLNFYPGLPQEVCWIISSTYV